MNKNSINHYKALNISTSASPEEIKRAYRKAAILYHPDTGGTLSSTNKFNFINEAYRILSDPDLRHAYDLKISEPIQTIQKAQKEPQLQPENITLDRHAAYSAAKYASKRNSRRQSSYSAAKSTPLSKKNRAQSSVWKKLKTKLHTIVKTYDLSFNRKRSIIDFTVSIDALESIQGTTRELEITTPDPSTKELRKIKFTIPPGVSNGDILRITKSASNDTLHKTFNIQIKVGNHPYFHIENKDIVIRVPITLQESIRGTTVAVPSLDGPIEVKIPPQNLESYIDRPRLRISNKGLPLKGGNRSNLLIETFIVAPNVMTEEHIQALNTLEKTYSQKNIREKLPMRFSLQHENSANKTK